MTTTEEPVDLLSPELMADPVRRVRADARAGARAHRLVAGWTADVLVTRYDDVRTVLTDPRFFTNPGSVPGGRDGRLPGRWSPTPKPPSARSPTPRRVRTAGRS